MSVEVGKFVEDSYTDFCKALKVHLVSEDMMSIMRGCVSISHNLVCDADHVDIANMVIRDLINATITCNDAAIINALKEVVFILVERIRILNGRICGDIEIDLLPDGILGVIKYNNVMI